MHTKLTQKEKGLIKGALRRIFSRSDLRRQALDKYRIEHFDPEHPRVTRWNWCPDCGLIYPAYLSQVDHVLPIIRTNETLDSLTLDELVSRIWSDIENLRAVDKECHALKTKVENKERAKFRKANR